VIARKNNTTKNFLVTNFSRRGNDGQRGPGERTQGLGNGVEGERPVHRGLFVPFVLAPSRAWFRIACSGFIFFLASAETDISRPDPLYLNHSVMVFIVRLPE